MRKHKEITKEKDFFVNYQSKKDKLQTKEKEWEELVTKLNSLKGKNANS